MVAEVVVVKVVVKVVVIVEDVVKDVVQNCLTVMSKMFLVVVDSVVWGVVAYLLF